MAFDFTLVPNDWQSLEEIINYLGNKILTEQATLGDYLKSNGSKPLTGNWSTGNYNIVCGGNVSGGNITSGANPGHTHTDGSGGLNSETDPVFSAWDKSTGISITESQISDFGSYENPLTFSTPLARDTDTISIPQSNSTTNGYLDMYDWQSFNLKADYDFGANSFSGTGDFTGSVITGSSLVSTGTLSVSGNVISNLKFTDNTYDIGASGATRPRHLYIAQNGIFGGTLGVTGLSTLTGGAVIPNASTLVIKSAGDDKTITFSHNDTNAVINNSSGDITVTCPSDKTIVLSETVWDDLPPYPVLIAKLGSSAPTLSNFGSANIQLYTFDVDNICYGSTEITHKWKEGTTIYPHIHYATQSSDGTDRGVKWELIYTIGDGDEVFSSESTTVIDDTILASTAAYTHKIKGFDTAITGTNYKIGAYINWRLKRVATSHANGNPASSPYALAIGFHIEEDTIGSRTITSK